MLVHTTCRSCGGSLLLGLAPECNAQQSPYWHDDCPPKPTRMERLCEQYIDRLHRMPASDPELQRLEAEIESLQARPPRLADAALKYASWGWPVFPLKSGTKEPATKHGFQDATSDSDRIKRWWQRHPTDNIGLATGHRFDVIDIDVPKTRKNGTVTPAGAIAYSEMLAKVDPATGRGPLPDCHGMAATASGGLHLYVEPTGSGNRGGWKPGIDIRGVGGYVVAPPSVLGDRSGAWGWTYVPSPTLTGVLVDA